jgi:hypothetical protein
MTEINRYPRGGLVVVVYKVTCSDGSELTVEEETAGDISYEEPPPPPEYIQCPGPDDPAYDPNNEACW